LGSGALETLDVLERTQRSKQDAGGIPMSAFQSIAAFFRGLFGRKDDDFKTLLMSDLGIER
jgi:hypothetical protein